MERKKKKKRKNVFFRALYSIDEASFSERFSKIFPSKKKKGLIITFHYRVSISSGKINFGSRNFPPFEEGEFFSLLLFRITDQATEEEKNEFPTRPNNFSRPSRWSPGTTRLSTRREDGGQLSINLYFPSPLVSASPRHEIPVFHDSNSWLFTLRLSPCPEEEEEEEIADPVRRRNLLDRP